MSRYYLCEAESADEGVTQVTPFDDAAQVLEAANNSTGEVHFVSTVNPLSEDEEEQE
jgi:hypothetical protein